jgi:Tfp pilus assembly protein PilO
MANRFISDNLRNFIQTSRGKSQTVAATTILLLLAMFLFGVYPALGAIIEQIDVNAKRTDALGQIETKRLTLRDLVVEEGEKEAVALALNTSLPDELDQEALLSSIIGLVQETDNVLLAINFSSVESRRLVYKVFATSKALHADVITISLGGERASLEEFLRKLENARRIVNLRNISLEKDDKGGETRPFRLEVQGEVYYWSIETEE